MGKSKGIGAGTVLVTAGAGLIIHQYVQLWRTDVRIKDLRILKITTKVLRFDLILEVENHTLIPITVVSQDYKLLIQDKLIVRGFSNDLQVIEAGTTSLLEFRFNIPIRLILNVLKTEGLKMFVSPQLFKVTFKAEINLKVFGIKVVIPYTYITDLKKLINLSKKKS